MATTPAVRHGPPSAGGGRDAEGGGTPRGVWLLVGTIAGAKLATFGVVVWAARAPEAGLLIGVTLPPWLLAAVLLLAGPLLFRLRLHRVRARRARLHRAEWLLPEPAAADLGRWRPRFRPHGTPPVGPGP